MPTWVNDVVEIDTKKRKFENYRRYFSKINMEIALPNWEVKNLNITFPKLLFYLGIVDKPKIYFSSNNDDRAKYGDTRVDVTFNNMHFKVNEDSLNPKKYEYFTFNDIANKPISKQFISSKTVENNYYVEAYNIYDRMGFPGSGINLLNF